MKVCDVTQFYAPRSGGVKRYLHEKARFVASRDDEHVLVVPGQRTCVSNGPCNRIYTIASPRLPKTGGYRALLNLRAVGEIIEREQPDIVESADPYQLGWHVATTAKMFRIPAIAFYHSHFYEAYLERIVPRSLAKAYVRALYNQFECTLVASAALARELQSWRVPNVQVQQLGVDTTCFRRHDDRDATRDSLGIPSTRFLLLYAGRLSPEKNVTVLFNAFELLPKKFHLLVIGDGPKRATLDDLKDRHSNMSSLSYCADPAELARYYRAADLLIHPGQRETFGLAAIEAQACGTPVLGVGRTRLNEIIAHDQSWWAPENSAEALAAAIQRAFALDLRAIGTAASRAVHERFNWRAVFERLFCIYHEVCSKYQRAHR